MASESKRTTNHDRIRKWVEDRGGYPATVGATSGNRGAGLLRIDFPGYSGEGRLKRISWDQFFDKFEEKNLVFLYQDKTRGGNTSRFSKFVAGKPGERRASARRSGEHESDAHAQAVRAAKRVKQRQEEIKAGSRQVAEARDRRQVAGRKRQAQREATEEPARAEHEQGEARGRRAGQRESRPAARPKRPPEEVSVQDLKPGEVIVYEPGKPPRVENEAQSADIRPQPTRQERGTARGEREQQPAAKTGPKRQAPKREQAARSGTGRNEPRRPRREEEPEPQAVEVVEEEVIAEKEPRRAGDRRGRREAAAEERRVQVPAEEMEAEPAEETEEAIVITEPVAERKSEESETPRKRPAARGRSRSKSRKPAQGEEMTAEEGQPEDEVEEFIEKL